MGRSDDHLCCLLEVRKRLLVAFLVCWETFEREAQHVQFSQAPMTHCSLPCPIPILTDPPRRFPSKNTLLYFYPLSVLQPAADWQTALTLTHSFSISPHLSLWDIQALLSGQLSLNLGFLWLLWLRCYVGAMVSTLGSMKLLFGLALGLALVPFGVLAKGESKLANRTIERVGLSLIL